jgi:hypothetical protein
MRARKDRSGLKSVSRVSDAGSGKLPLHITQTPASAPLIIHLSRQLDTQPQGMDPHAGYSQQAYIATAMNEDDPGHGMPR